MEEFTRNYKNSRKLNEPRLLKFFKCWKKYSWSKSLRCPQTARAPGSDRSAAITDNQPAFSQSKLVEPTLTLLWIWRKRFSPTAVRKTLQSNAAYVTRLTVTGRSSPSRRGVHSSPQLWLCQVLLLIFQRREHNDDNDEVFVTRDSFGCTWRQSVCHTWPIWDGCGETRYRRGLVRTKIQPASRMT